MKTILLLFLLGISTPAFAESQVCEGLATLAESVMEFKIAGASREATQFIVDDRAAHANLSPDVEFAITNLPDMAFDFPGTDKAKFRQFVYDDCDQ